MSTAIGQALAILQNLLAARRASGESITRDSIASTIGQVLPLLPGLGPEARKELQFELETRFSTWIGHAQVLADDRDHVAWLPAKFDSIKWRYWDRYLTLIDQQMALEARNRLDDTTTDILARLEDPDRPGRWSRRGLIVGHVQSGKTANYIGLVCKAADAGYKVIVVLAGMHKNLRTQTQIRLDEGFLGYDSSPAPNGSGRRAIGVGLLEPSLWANTITTREDDGDFRTGVANSFHIAPGGLPLLFVVKKNKTVLSNLVRWVEGFASPTGTPDGARSVRDVPLLVIDDEADQSSVDTGALPRREDGTFDPEYEPKPINALIRRLLHLFDKHAYVGYTATPFANIYIHEEAVTTDEGEDLFPRSFIIGLPAPSNYWGPATLFPDTLDIESTKPWAIDSGAEASPFLRIVNDYLPNPDVPDDKGWMPAHNRTHIPLYRGEKKLPPSLRRAIRSFILASSARVARGQGQKHKSMLIHVTRFTDVQGEVVRQVRAYADTLRDAWRNEDVDLKKEMRCLWETDYEPVCASTGVPLVWAAVEPHVWTILRSVMIKEINGSSADILEYEQHREVGLTVIAVGGDKLSRGLTLEGLTTSYFLRSSRMYDTLMQMGRWFGYRPGYGDLCRLYLTRELVTWFRDIAIASEELREQFEHMVATGMTPEKYGMRVRAHPSLLITSPVKCRSSVLVKVNFAGSISETVTFERRSLGKNFEALRALLSRIGRPLAGSEKMERYPMAGSTSHMWHDVKATDVVRFLKEYTTPESAYRANSQKLAEYIESQIPTGGLRNWTVLLASPSGGKSVSIADLQVGITTRSTDSTEPYRIKRIINPADEWADLDSMQYTDALALTRSLAAAKRSKDDPSDPPSNPSGLALRRSRPESQGLLILYMLTPNGKSLQGDASTYVGFGLSFPGTSNLTEVTYRVNNVYRESELADLGVDA
jgi:hypothetical protein